MQELLDIFDLSNRLLGQQERGEFYREAKEEFRRTGKVTRKVKQIRVLMMNADGNIVLQKRSSSKAQNAGLFDKTIGGHVQHGHTIHVTLVKECAEELGIPAVMLNDDEFAQAIGCTDLKIIGLFKTVGENPNFQSIRITPDGEFIQPVITTFIIGYYDGSVRFVDGESSGIEIVEPTILIKDIDKHPERYTEDLRYYLKNYSSFLLPLNTIARHS
ncbi:MAG: NUDIX domain-containing protein [Candidatus Peribacteraceae bacterium]|nr:NUDIX domain-containing protein [Candidatus Peribacteraceae bacterium]